MPADATLIYDGACGFCRDAVALLGRWDRAGRVRVLAFQDEQAVAPFGLGRPALAAAVHLVLADGRVFAGADAVAEALRLLPGRRWLGALLRLPGVRALARRGYAWVAVRRHCLVRPPDGVKDQGDDR